MKKKLQIFLNIILVKKKAEDEQKYKQLYNL